MNELLEKYFAEITSDAEKQTLFQEIERNADLKEEYVRLQNTVALSVMAGKESDETYGLRKYLEIMRQINVTQKKRRYLSFTKYAAIFIMLIATWFVAVEFSGDNDGEEYTYIEVPKGQQIHVTLADKSEVWLSSRSQLKIGNQFNKKTRNIELDGEAFFSVSHDAEVPFVVKTSKYNVKVTGTQFNVFAYDESPIFETDLVEGGVSIYKEEGDDCILLKPNEKVFLQEGTLQKDESSFADSYSIKNGIYSFENKTVKEIAERLELWYDVKLIIEDESIANSVIRGKFRQTDSIDNILKAIKETGKFNYVLISEREIKLYE